MAEPKYDEMKYFNRSEFACDCGCGLNAVDFELYHVLYKARVHFGERIFIGGNRCRYWNSLIPGSSDTSKHMDCIAADVNVENVKPEHVFNYFCSMYPEKYGIGIYDTHVHIDMRKVMTRWDRREAS